MKNLETVKPKIICIICISFALFFVAGCNGNGSTNGNQKKSDTVFVQPNNQNGEGMDGSHGGMGDDKRGIDSSHRGMGHAPIGMDSSHHKKYE